MLPVHPLLEFVSSSFGWQFVDYTKPCNNFWVFLLCMLCDIDFYDISVILNSMILSFHWNSSLIPFKREGAWLMTCCCCLLPNWACGGFWTDIINEKLRFCCSVSRVCLWFILNKNVIWRHGIKYLGILTILFQN